jgi:pantothenate kinase type III
MFVLCDLGNTATEFAGVASAAPIFGGFLGVTSAAL